MLIYFVEFENAQVKEWNRIADLENDLKRAEHENFVTRVFDRLLKYSEMDLQSRIFVGFKMLKLRSENEEVMILFVRYFNWVTCTVDENLKCRFGK